MLIGVVAPGHADQVSVNGVRIWEAPDHTRLVLELSEPVEHKILLLDQPDRLVLDLKNAYRNSGLDTLDLGKTPVKSVRSAPRNQTDYRIVLDLKQKIQPRSFLLPANAQYGHRLVVDLHGTAAPSNPAQAPETLKTLDARRDIVIVIDPGHGGEDPGAIGPGRVREKDVVLAISKQLRDLINRQDGFQAVLTRESDYYIELRNRSSFARKQNADLLVSIHADAFIKSSASGASVFALSHRGASNEMARWLAQRENAADLIGGVSGVKLEDKDEVLASVLLDLSSTASLKASLSVGDHVLRSMGGVSRLHQSHVQQAGFVVLKSPDIPSILIETGFISNLDESRRLNSVSYQKKMAQAISFGITKYFDHSPPPGTLLAWQKEQRRLGQDRAYIVKKGDTLSHIASKNAVSVSELRQLNGLRGDHLSPGQTLRLPSS
jgi:N-acetylmuramoyl-L-alanine amidase